MSRKSIILGLFAIILIAAATPKTISIFKSTRDFDIAQERITNAISEGIGVLDLRDLKHLTKIPETARNIENLFRIDAANAERLSDIRAIEGVNTIKGLVFRNTRVSDLSSVRNLNRLETLDIGKTWVEDLQPLSGLKRLRWLQMHEIGTASLCPLKDVLALNWVNLYKSYAVDGSTDCFEKLQRRVQDIGGGSSYKQGYKPGTPYRIKVSLERFLKFIEWR